MLLYFDFEGIRYKADLTWPKDDGAIIVHLTDKELTDSFPGDLFFNLNDKGIVGFDAEDMANSRLLGLQNCLRKRIQELCY